MTDSEHQRNEAAKPIAEDIDWPGDPEPIEGLGNSVGIAGDRLGGRRGAKTGQIDKDQPARPRQGIGKACGATTTSPISTAAFTGSSIRHQPVHRQLL
jgi:hypothetical protein